MIDSFPYDSWLNADGELNTDITTFWTFGPGVDHDVTGTYVLTVLGCILMVVAWIAWVVQEDRKMKAQAARLRDAGL
jgi:hypothetical protein